MKNVILRKREILDIISTNPDIALKGAFSDLAKNKEDFKSVYLDSNTDNNGNKARAIIHFFRTSQKISDNDFVRLYVDIEKSGLDNDYSLFSSIFHKWSYNSEIPTRIQDHLLRKYSNINSDSSLLKSALLKGIADLADAPKVEIMSTFNKILKVKGDVNTLYNGQSALHVAAKNGNKTYLIDALVKAGANYRLMNKDGKNAMQIAIEENNKRNKNYFLKLAGENEEDVVQDSIDTSLSKKELTDQLLTAYDKRNFKLFSALVDAGANVNFNSTETTGVPFISKMMKRNNNENFIQKILDNGAYINATDNYGWTPLHHAINENRLSYFNILIENKNINCDLMDIKGLKAIDYSINKEDYFTQLLAKTNLDYFDRDGNTLFHRSCVKCSKISTIEALSSYFNLSEKDSIGRTPMQICSERRFDKGKELIEALILQQAVSSLPDKRVKTRLSL